MNQKIKVLIVDDEASQRCVVAAMVSAWGMISETASDGEEALAKLTNFPADVIVTDLNMPGLDGFGLLERLRDTGDSPHTIVLTAYGNIETAVKTVHEMGAYWFLEKPIQPGPLEILIRRAGSRGPSWEESPRMTAPRAQVPAGDLATASRSHTATTSAVTASSTRTSPTSGPPRRWAARTEPATESHRTRTGPSARSTGRS